MGLVPRSLLAAALLGGMGAMAQPAPEYQAKVVLLDKLTRFVTWPQSASRPFLIGVLGRTPFGDELDAYFAHRTLKGRPVAVNYYRDAQEVGECDVLFVCASERPRLQGLLARLKGRPTLTVSDAEGFAEAGVMVGIVRAEARLTFEVNLTPTRQSGFRMEPGFLQLAKLIQ
jgi:hypothetical protein